MAFRADGEHPANIVENYATLTRSESLLPLVGDKGEAAALRRDHADCRYGAFFSLRHSWMPMR